MPQQGREEPLSNETLLAALRAHTHDQHIRLENQQNWQSADFDLARYRDLLARFYGWYAPMEARLARAADWEALGYDFEARRKTPLLADDLRALGIADPAGLPRCEALPEVKDAASALGCMYVIEGSTLGGQMLTRHFKAQLGLTPARGCAFFGSYGADVGPRWVAFRAFLAAADVSGAAEDAAIASARATFDTLGAWLQGAPAAGASPHAREALPEVGR